MVILSTRADMVCVCASASVCVGLKHYNKGVGVGFITWRSGTRLHINWFWVNHALFVSVEIGEIRLDT